MPQRETGFRGTSLPADFYAAIEKFVNEHPELGYKSVSDLVQESARLRLQELKPKNNITSRFEQINSDENGVKIHDRTLREVVEVYIKPEGVQCSYDRTDECEHVNFALTLPEVKAQIRKHRKEGWKLPDV